MARRPQRQKPAQPKATRPDNAPAPKPPVARALPPKVDEPRFFFGFTVPWAKIAIVRFALFGVLAIDAFLALRHAPRYGTGFNVAHLRFLDGLAPDRVLFTLAELVLAYVFALFALGVALWLLPVAAALYGWIYFSSQLDSYQHHYLVFLVLVLLCFAPLRRVADDDPPPRAWALRLVLLQLGIVYLWAATAKIAAGWLDGSALHLQLGDTSIVARSIAHLPGTWATAARLALAMEMFLAVAVWFRPLWWAAVPLGIAFHLGIELSGLQIGLFSYVMFALYTLALPDAIFAGATRWFGGAAAALRAKLRAIGARAGAWPWIVPATTAVALIVALAVAHVGAAPTTFLWLAAEASLIGAIVARLRGGPLVATRVLVANLAIAAMFTIADRATTVSYDYFKFWGGSAKRLGRLDEARTAYERMAEIAPHSATPHVQLAGLDLTAGNGGAALVQWDAAEEADPHDARAFMAEARWLADQQRTDEALGAALAAFVADPRDPDAWKLVHAIETSAKPPAAAPDAPDADDHP